MILQVEGSQLPNRQGADSFTIPEVMAYYRVPGLSVAVICDFAIHWAKSWGVADVETGAPATNETLYQAASASKPVAAMASLKAVETGAFGLDQDINTILTSWRLPESPFKGGPPVTPRTLLEPHIRHRRRLRVSRLRTWGAAPDRAADSRRSAAIQSRPSSIGPTAAFRLTLLGRRRPDTAAPPSPMRSAQPSSISCTTGFSARSAWPTAPSNSLYPAPREKLAARGHDWRGQAMNAPWHVYPEQAAAGLWTTPVDLAKFMIEVQRTMAGQSSSVLNRATMQEMVTPVGVGPLRRWIFDRAKGRRLVFRTCW